MTTERKASARPELVCRSINAPIRELSDGDPVSGRPLRRLGSGSEPSHLRAAPLSIRVRTMSSDVGGLEDLCRANMCAAIRTRVDFCKLCIADIDD